MAAGFSKRRGPETSQYGRRRSTTRKLVRLECAVCGAVFFDKPSEVKRGRRFCSKACFGRYMSETFSGENSPFWKGTTSERDRIFHTPEYRAWKVAVFARDNYTCQECGLRSGNGNGYIHLQAHHIKSFINYPLLRFDIDNGLTLCRDCHYEVHRGQGNKPKAIERVMMF